MKYISNMQVRKPNNTPKNEEKAVFPPNTVIPEALKEEATVYLPENKNYYVRDNELPKSKAQHGYMDYDGMEFPLPKSMVLKKTENVNFPVSAENQTLVAPSCINKNFNDFVCMNLGKYAQAEFFMGTDTYMQKSGVLSGAGKNFIVLENSDTKEKTICNLSNMKFLTLSDEQF